MCGISCILALDEHTQRSSQQERSKTSSRIVKSLEQIRHRGPDSSGHWISEDGRVALGHVRLEINDLSPSGAQPLQSSDRTVHAVVNGEIYDYDRLKSEMISKFNYQFGGTSDCELVLALYQYYGLSFLSHLRGEFSLCLYDSDRDFFIAVRDRYGIKPLFWTVQNGELWVAAEIKAFLPLGWTPDWDVDSIVGGDFQIGSATIFKGVQKVRPGHILICRSRGTIHEQPYWDSGYPDKNTKDPRTETEMIEGVRTRLLFSIRERLRADVKVGVSLSGGLDSSVVAGMVNHLVREGAKVGSESPNERLSCFGIAFDEDSGFDESAAANRTADFLGVKFYKKHMNEEALAGAFEDATWHDEQPNPDLNFIGTYALSELFREQGFRVNVNGQGADEIFGGYNIFLPDFLREPDLTFNGPTTPEELRKSELHKAEARLNELYQSKLDLNPVHPSVAHRQLNNTLTPAQMIAAFPPVPINPLFLPLTAKGTALDIQQTYTESLPPTVHTKIATQWHPLHTAQYIFTHGHLQNLLLSHLGDRGEMAHSIEGRTPFLDHPLTEYVNGLPPSMKIRWDEERREWVEKYVLREAGRDFITDEIYRMRKHPYSAPLKYPRGGPLYTLLKGLVSKEKIERLGFLQGEGAEELLQRAFDQDEEGKEGNEGRRKAAFKLVICLAQWVVLAERFGVVTARPRPRGRLGEGRDAREKEEGGRGGQRGQGGNGGEGESGVLG